MTAHSIQEPGDWIEWSGGECPVDGNTLVRVKLRGGEYRSPDPASYFRWWHSGTVAAGLPYDIVAYCVVPK